MSTTQAVQRPLAHARAWLTGLFRTDGFPDALRAEPELWAGAIVGALHAAVAHPNDDPRIDVIVATVQRIETAMSATQTAVDHVGAAVASMKSEVQADVAGVATQVADLKQQIADLKAAGGGATIEQIASLESSATDLETTVKALRDGLNPAPVVVHTPLDTTDSTPNSPGGRNNFFLADFDPSQPETP